MILEGIVTTQALDGTINVAPMGPQFDREDWSHFFLKPFNTSRTYDNLRSRPEGVFHVTDDVFLLARTAVSDLDEPPPMKPASRVRGAVLTDVCRAYEFRIVTPFGAEERPTLRAEVVAVHRFRDFFGINRACYAVVEAAILATRTALLPMEQIEASFHALAILIEKTGGDREKAAFQYLQNHLDRVKAEQNSA